MPGTERERESGVFTIDFCTFIIEESTTCVCVCVCVSISDLSNQSFVRGRKRNASTSNHVLFFDCHHDFSHNHFFLLRLFFPFLMRKSKRNLNSAVTPFCVILEKKTHNVMSHLCIRRVSLSQMQML